MVLDGGCAVLCPSVFERGLLFCFGVDVSSLEKWMFERVVVVVVVLVVLSATMCTSQSQ